LTDVRLINAFVGCERDDRPDSCAGRSADFMNFSLAPPSGQQFVPFPRSGAAARPTGRHALLFLPNGGIHEERRRALLPQHVCARFSSTCSGSRSGIVSLFGVPATVGEDTLPFPACRMFVRLGPLFPANPTRPPRAQRAIGLPPTPPGSRSVAVQKSSAISLERSGSRE